MYISYITLILDMYLSLWNPYKCITFVNIIVFSIRATTNNLSYVYPNIICVTPGTLIPLSLFQRIFDNFPFPLLISQPIGMLPVLPHPDLKNPKLYFLQLLVGLLLLTAHPSKHFGLI